MYIRLKPSHLLSVRLSYNIKKHRINRAVRNKAPDVTLLLEFLVSLEKRSKFKTERTKTK